jgi:hypothetical protein
MANYKALVSFSGKVSMSVGEVADLADVTIAKDLLKAGYIEEIKPAEKVKATKPIKDTKDDETKPTTKGKTKRG